MHERDWENQRVSGGESRCGARQLREAERIGGAVHGLGGPACDAIDGNVSSGSLDDGAEHREDRCTSATA